MRVLLLQAMLLILLMLAGCMRARPAAEAGDGATPSSGAEAGAEGSPQQGDKLVCRRERVTGSHMRKKVCRYEEQRDADREAAQDVMRRRSQNVGPGEGP